MHVIRLPDEAKRSATILFYSQPAHLIRPDAPLAGATSSVVKSLPGSPRIHYYEVADIVSNTIKSGKDWEGPDVQNILWAMQQPLPPQAAASRSKAAGLKGQSFLSAAAIADSHSPADTAGGNSGKGGVASEKSRALFVDVGANIGWFTANVASHGYHVAAFEGELLEVLTHMREQNAQIRHWLMDCT